MNKKFILLAFICALSLFSLSVAAQEKGDWWGFVKITNDSGNNLTAEYGVPIDFYVNGVWQKQIRTGTVGGLGSGYYAATLLGNIGDSVSFRIWGSPPNNATPETFSVGYHTGPDYGQWFNLTFTEIANSAACNNSNACSGGYCCSGSTEILNNATAGTCQATACNTPPVLNASTQSATSVTVGGVVTFNVNVTDASNSISNVSAELENPSGTKTNYSMTLAEGTNGAGNRLKYELNFTTVSPTGTWYAKFYANDTSGNIGNTTDRNLTLTVNAASSSSSGGGGGGGGGSSGGGGGGASAVSETSTVSGSVVSGGTGTFQFTKAADTGVSSIEVTTSATVTNPQITVKETTLGSGQTAAISSTSGSVYQYLTITKTNIKDSDIKGAKVKFQVLKSWAVTNDIDPMTIALTKFVSNAWDKQPTTFLKEDNDYYYYEATVTGFSLFAVAGEKRPEKLTSFQIIDTIRDFYAGKSAYNAFGIIDLIRKFYA